MLNYTEKKNTKNQQKVYFIFFVFQNQKCQFFKHYALLYDVCKQLLNLNLSSKN